MIDFDIEGEKIVWDIRNVFVLYMFNIKCIEFYEVMRLVIMKVI